MDGSEEDTKKLKELLYRVEAERLQLQQHAASLADNKQQLTSDVLKLREQLAEVHAALEQSQKQGSDLSTLRDRLEVQVKCATSEYRANDIIAVGLRDQITRLQHELKTCQHVCAQQAAEIATFSGDMASLRTSRADLTQQLAVLQQQNLELQEQHAGTVQHLARAQQNAQDIQQRWVDEHGDQARQLQAVQEGRQQAEDRGAELSTQLEQEQQQLAQQRERIAALEGELTHIRELVVLLGKAMGRLPGGQQLPGHDDPVWLQLGPLGGVSFALDTVIQHTREQHVRVRELQAEFDKMEDRVCAESAQKADLQSELYEARTMYAKAVALREALEARTTCAEAEKAAAEASLLQAKAQAGEDVSRLSSLQEQVLSLSQQVQLLQPLQPKLSTAEAERDAAMHKLERLQEQYDQLQRQLQHAVAREAGLQAEVDANKLEQTQLLAANAQLMAQCTGLQREMQELEVDVREGTFAKGQLEEAKRKLGRQKTQLKVMADRHVDTLSRLESTKDLLASVPPPERGQGGNSSSSRPASAWGKASRPSTAAKRVALPGSAGSSPRESPRSSNVGAAQQQHQQQQQQQQQAGGTQQGHPSATATASSDYARNQGAAVAGGGPMGHAAAAAAAGVGAAGSSDGASRTAGAAELQGQIGSDSDVSLQHTASQQVDALLRQRELENLAAAQQEELDGLQQQLQQQQAHVVQLEVQLLQQEVAHLQQLQASEESVSGQCLGAAAEAVAALQAALTDLQQALQGPKGGSDAGNSSNSSSESVDPENATAVSDGSEVVAGAVTGADSAAEDQQDLELQQQQEQQQQQQPQKWLSRVAGEMVSTMQVVLDAAQARARQVAARQSVGVQSDEALQSQWVAFLRGVPDARVAQPLHLKATSEAILRLYMRGLSQLEAHALQRQRGAAGMLSGGSLGGGGPVLTVFDLLMAHYTLPAQHATAQHAPAQHLQHGRVSVTPYSAALWRDPQGPITRLLVSCRLLGPSSIKVALFCCLAGTHTPGASSPWGVQHWQQFLLLLHATKQLTGGLWKSLLRGWAAAGGALLPLQCVEDLLGNVYNASSLAALEQQPAVLGSRQLLFGAMQGARPGSSPSREAAAVGVGDSSRAGSATGARDSSQQQQQQHQQGSVAAALRELVVDGPLGPASAVDFDDLLAMLMVQYDAGLLPTHPLMQPRRLTTGDLGNTTNAWGSAATQAAAGLVARRSTLLSPAAGLTPLALASEGSDAARSELGCTQPNSPSGLSTASGWVSRPSTGAAASRIGTAADRRGGEQAGSPGAAGGGLTLPRIKTPDTAPKDGRLGSSSGGGPGALSGNGSSLSGSKSALHLKKGTSFAHVAFKEGLARDK